MLNTEVLKYETPSVWTHPIMPQENKKKPVELIDGGLGDGTAVYRVGRKIIYVTFGEDGARDDLFVTTIVNAYVKTLRTQKGYFVPDTFEMDKTTGTYKKIKIDDEKLLIEKLAKDDIFSISESIKEGISAQSLRIVGTHYSAENGIVYSNPLTPDKPPKLKRDKRLEH